LRWPAYVEQYQNPSIDVVLLDYSWEELEPQEGVFDFADLESKLAIAQQDGKRVALCLWDHTYDLRHPGPGLPEWVVCAKLVYEYGTGQRLEMPVRWDPIFQEKWANFVWEIATRYGNSFEFVLITETALPWNKTLRPLWKEAGYSVQVYEQALEENVLLFTQAFPNSAVLQSINQFTGSAPSFFKRNPQDEDLMWDLAAQCSTDGVGFCNPGLRAKDYPAQTLYVFPIFETYQNLVPEAQILNEKALNDGGVSTIFDVVEKGFSIGSMNYFIVPSLWLGKPDGPAMVDYAHSLFFPVAP
jgi:hypothetical protein